MAENIANLVATLLNGAIDSDDTSMVVDSATGFPEANFRLIIQDSESDDANREIVLVTAKASTTFTITRGQEGTTGVAHGDNSYVAHVLTAGALEAFVGTRAFIGCIAKRVSGTLASTGSYQPVPLNGEDKDTDGYHSTSVNPSRITIPTGRAGTYLVLGSFYGADTLSYISVRKNGTTHLDRYGITGDDGIGSTHALVDLAEGDYLELVVNSGSTTINAAYLEVMLIGAPNDVSDPLGSVMAVRVARVAPLNAFTEAAIPWDTAVRDDGGFWTAGLPTRLTAPEDGWYQVGGGFISEVSNMDSIYSRLVQNGTTTLQYDTDRDPDNTTQKAMRLSTAVYLAAGDYVEMLVQANASVGIAGACHMWMAKVALSTTDRIFDLLNSKKPSADTPDDEFDAATLNPKWTAVSGSAGVVDLFETADVAKYDLSTRNGWLLMQAGVGVDVRLRQTFTLPDGASIVIPVSVASPAAAGDNMQVGIVLNTTDAFGGTYVQMFLDQDTAGEFVVQANSSTDTAGVEVLDEGYDIGRVMYFRISRVGLSYRCFVSWDGSSWTFLRAEAAAAAFTRLWIHMAGPSAAKNTYAAIAAIPWIRQGSNGLDPWSPYAAATVVVPDSDADEFVGPFNPYDATEPSLAQGVNTAYFQKFVPRRSVTIRNVTFRVITQAGNLDFGIYDDAMTRLGSTGSFACPAPSGENNRALTAPVTLVRGRTYYFACATDSATYRTTGIARTTSVMLPVTSNVRLLGSQTNALPLPATAAPNWENGSTTPRASMIFY